VGTDDGSELVSLYRWLSGDAAVADRVQVVVETRDGQHGAMGGAFNVINAMFADGSAVAAIGSLFLAYRTWRDTRQTPPALKIEKDGVTVLVNSGSDQEMRHVVELMLNRTTEDQAEDTGEERVADGTSTAGSG